MDFEIYCDESGLEALSNPQAHNYSAIGGIWIPAQYRDELKKNLSAIKTKHNITGEFKWQKISPYYLSFYKEIIDYFFSAQPLRFRVVLIESAKVNHIKFNDSDGELGFYKFYYQLLHHWIFDFNSYEIFTDLKINRDRGRLKDLKLVLEKSNLTSHIKQIQGLPSHQALGIQLADLLTGLVNSKFNRQLQGTAKASLIKYVEEKYLGNSILPTPKWAEKFNVFKINLQGGW